MSSIGYRLRELLREHGLNQKTFARYLGLKLSTLNGYVNNHRTPEIDMQMRIADYFGVTLDYLNGRVNERNLPEKRVYSTNIDLIKGGMSCEELSADIAKKLNFPLGAGELFPPGYLENITKGKTTPSPTRVKLLAAYAGVPIDFFYTHNTAEDLMAARELLKNEQKTKFMGHMTEKIYEFVVNPNNLDYILFAMNMADKGINPEDVTSISLKYSKVQGD